MRKSGNSPREIHKTFAEHRPLSFDDWEIGFRHDDAPMRETVLWSHAADVSIAFAKNEPSADRRQGVYRCVIAGLTTMPDTIWMCSN